MYIFNVNDEVFGVNDTDFSPFLFLTIWMDFSVPHTEARFECFGHLRLAVGTEWEENLMTLDFV